MSKEEEDPLKVSVLVTTYNHAPYLRRCLNSLLSQSLDESLYEVVVIDDGSTDETPIILSEFKDRVRLYSQTNQGLVKSCNKGFKLCKGTYVVRVDSDDLAGTDLLLHESCVLDLNPDVEFVVSDRIEVEASRQNRATVNLTNIFSLIACGAMFRRDGLLSIGGYRFLFWEEYDLFIRILQRGSGYRVDQSLYFYYRHGGNMTDDRLDRERGWKDLIDRWGIETLRKFGYCEELERVWSCRHK